MEKREINWPGLQNLRHRLEAITASGLSNPFFESFDFNFADNVSGLINYSSYDYLCLAKDRRVIEASTSSVFKYGTSCSSSRVISGQRDCHEVLEEKLSLATGFEKSLVFPAGYLANVATIATLFGPKDLIIYDSMIHSSCRSGIKLSGARSKGFRHNNFSHLEQVISRNRAFDLSDSKILILVEGVDSISGSIPNLPELLKIKEKYKTLLMVDEAHSFGTIGRNGLGICDYYNVEPGVIDIYMGSLSKALASMGGWISGNRDLIDVLRYSASGFVFSAGLVPSVCCSAIKALEILFSEKDRVEKLNCNSKCFYEEMKGRNIVFDSTSEDSPVFSVPVGDTNTAIGISEQLRNNGIVVKPIVFPAVPEGSARLRFFVNSEISREQIEYTARCLRELV